MDLYCYKAELSRVVDGDTVDAVLDLGFGIYHKLRIRLAGIDAPETRTRDLAEKKEGKAAHKRLEELLIGASGRDGRFVVQTELDKRGKYGRILGTLFVGDVNINELLIQEGHATRYEG